MISRCGESGVAAAPLPEHRRRQEGQVTGGPGPPLGVSAYKPCPLSQSACSRSKALVSENLLAMANQSLSGGLSIHSFLSSLDILRDMKDRRLIRSHLHVDFLPKDVLTAGCKVKDGICCSSFRAPFPDNTHHTAPQRRRRLPVQPPPSNPQVQGWIEHLRAFANSRNE
jgi:hypothetical protein